MTDDHDAEEHNSEVPSETQPVDAGHDVEMADESELRKRASNSPVDDLGELQTLLMCYIWSRWLFFFRGIDDVENSQSFSCDGGLFMKTRS